MQMTKRQFIQRASLATLGIRFAYATALSGLSLALTGCNVFSDILNWVPVGEASLNAILAVLTGNGVLISPALQTLVGLIEAGFTALTAAIKEYQSTVPAPVGALAKIETAFKDVVDNFKTFLSSLSVSGGLMGIVIGLAQIIFSTIAAFLNRLPAASSLRRTVVITEPARVGNTPFAVVPKERTRRAFKHDFNHVLDAGPTVGVIVPQSAYLHVTFWEHL
jgi:hypothetical protein